MKRWLVLLAACASDPAPPACDLAACTGQGRVCDRDACVDPILAGAPAWTTCASDSLATPDTLAAKALAYDARAIALHTHPQLPWVMDVQIAAGADPETATAADVVAWRSGENDGLFSALVLAAEAYRFAATRDPDARAALATLLRGEQLRMQITGVPGLFTRQLIPPGVAGITCPTDPAAYTPSPDKTANVWVAIDANGCANGTTHCGLDAFAGWCFLDNVSQDEYVGHIFALGAVARLVDDPELRAIAVDLLSQIGHHLVANGMQFVDWDGRPTQYGKVFPAGGTDSPGYLAVLGSSFLATSAQADPSLADAYAQLGYASSLDQIEVWNDCASNWNDLSMLTASFHDVVAADFAHASTWQPAFRSAMTSMPLGITAEHDAWYDLLWAERGDPTDVATVDDAICQLREFPRSNHEVPHDTMKFPEACTGRHGESMGAMPLSAADRCAATFAWWGNSYDRSACGTDATVVHQPSGYLLPYWMARYDGILTPND